MHIYTYIHKYMTILWKKYYSIRQARYERLVVILKQQPEAKVKQTLLIELKEAQAFLRRNVESLDIRLDERKKIMRYIHVQLF